MKKFLLALMLLAPACLGFVRGDIVVRPPLILSVSNSPLEPPPGYSVNITAVVNSYPRRLAQIFVKYFSSDRINQSQSMVLVQGNDTFGIYFATLASYAEETTVTYEVNAIDSSGFRGLSQPTTFHVKRDLTPPTFPILFPPVPYGMNPDLPITEWTEVAVKFTVRDSGSGVSKAVLRFSNSSDPAALIFQREMYLSGGNRYDGNWTGVIPATNAGTRVFFQAEAEDFFGNIGYSGVFSDHSYFVTSQAAPSASVHIAIESLNFTSKKATFNIFLSVYSPSRFPSDFLSSEIRQTIVFDEIRPPIPRSSGFYYQFSSKWSTPFYGAINLYPFDFYRIGFDITLWASGLNASNTSVEFFAVAPLILSFDFHLTNNSTQSLGDRVRISLFAELTRKPGLINPIMQAIYAIFFILGSSVWIRPSDLTRRIQLFLGLFTLVVVLFFTITPILERAGLSEIIGLSAPQALLMGLAWSVALLLAGSLIVSLLKEHGQLPRTILEHSLISRQVFSYCGAAIALVVTWHFSPTFVFGKPTNFLFEITEVQNSIVMGLFYAPLAKLLLDVRNRWRSRVVTMATIFGLFLISAWVLATLTSHVEFDYVSFIAVWIWPIISGILTSFLVVGLLYKIQQPSLIVTLGNDKYDERFEAHFVHLKVTNASKAFLGGGTAVNCRGKITLEDDHSFITKWATRANPVRTEIVSVGSELKLISAVEPAYIDQAKYEYLRPGDERSLDVAVRFRGESNCYIHEPENFTDPNYRPKRNQLPPGVYPFTVVFEYDGGRSKEFRFRIVNREGSSPSMLSLEMV